MSIDPKRRQAARQQAIELVAQMSLEEKINQMLHGAPAIDRLGVPAYNWWNEGLHGVARAGTATVFPQAIGLAASFDREVLQTVGDVVATEGRAKYNAQFEHGDHDIYKGLTFWSPNVNIFRDPRWGRGHETYGEDPYLSGELGVAFIHGIQGDDPEYMKAAACAKHYAVHSGPEEKRHFFDAISSQKDMRETYLPAFKACVQEGKVEAVMGAYNRTNGEACCASPTLLQDILRDEWGFEGHVVSDCWAISDLYVEDHHALVETKEEAAAMAIKAGCDLNCGCTYGAALEAVWKGLLDEETIDEAVIRLMTTRYLLGILGDSKQEFDAISYLENDTPENRKLNREIAQKTMVLLKNDGILPLTKGEHRTVGIIGPNANNRTALEGNYEGTASRYVTVAEGIQNALEDTATRVLYSDGCHLYADRYSNLAIKGQNDRKSEVQAICEASDLIIAVFGLDPGLEGEEGDQGNQFASGDKPNILLPGKQRETLELIYSYGKPVILIHLSGSAIALDNDAKHANAIIQAWYPGAEGGNAVADILYGDANPQAKLPVSFYSENYDLPDFEDYSMQGRTYRYHTDDILYPFGFGLSYTDFELGRVEAKYESEDLEIHTSVKNVGSRSGSQILQVYIEAPEHSTPYPQLRALTTIALRAGEEQDVTLTLPKKHLTVFNDDGDEVLTRGEYKVFVGFSQPDARSVELMGQAPIELTVTI